MLGLIVVIAFVFYFLFWVSVNAQLQAVKNGTLPVPAGGTAIVMHFAVQRGLTDTAGAQSQAEALVNLTDANALAGMSAAERAQVTNFVVP